MYFKETPYPQLNKFLYQDKMVRVAKYARCSSDEQRKHGYTIGDQVALLDDFVEEYGLVPHDTYIDEGVSATLEIHKRKALEQLIEDAVAGRYDIIVFKCIDRFFRNVGEYYEAQKRLSKAGVSWISIEEPDLNPNDPDAAFKINIYLSMAEYEAKKTSKRILFNNKNRLKNRQALTGAQSQGIAYTVALVDGLKRVVKNPETEEMVMDYVNHFLTYHNKRQAYLFVNEKHNTKVGYNTLAKTLVDTKMYGHYKGVDDYCEAYYSKETYDEIQILLKKNLKRTSSNRTYLFSGMLICPSCGKTLSGKYGGGKKVNKRPSGKIYTYDRDYYTYRCNYRYKDDTCNFNPHINEEKFEDALLENFEQYVNVHIHNVTVKDARIKSSKTMEKISSVKGEMTRVKNMYRKGDMTEEEYDIDMAELKTKLSKLEAQLEPMEERDLTVYEDLLKTNWRTIYDRLEKENKRAFWRKYVKALELNNDGTLRQIIFF